MADDHAVDGRNRWVRKMSPRANAVSTSASVLPGRRIPNAHLAPA